LGANSRFAEACTRSIDFDDSLGLCRLYFIMSS